MEVLANSPTSSSTTPHPDHLALNIAALRSITPAACDAILNSKPPHPAQQAIARDGAPTFAWTDPDNRLHWLGRTTMPEVRAEAVVEALQPGVGNLLVYGIAQGAEVLRLPKRLAAYQAVIVIEPDCWRMKLALSLHDYSREIERRRTLLFAGEDAWTQCRVFLEEHGGFLVPARILSWPWFDREATGFVSAQLAALQEGVIRGRAARRIESAPKMPPARRSSPEVRRVAVVSNSLDPFSHHLARRVAAGAIAAGHDVICFPFDSPTHADPTFVAQSLDAFGPTHTLVIDGTSTSLSYAVPSSHIAVICSAGRLPTEAALRALPANVRLYVHSPHDRAVAVERGVNPDRITLLPPSALPNIPSIQRAGPSTPPESAQGGDAPVSHAAPPCPRILVLTDRIDIAPESIGLHLTSHCRLWEAARRIIAAKPAAFGPNKAESILASAERDLGITIESTDVRRGLCDRIQAVLGPGIFQRALFDALAKSKLEFSLVGRGWSADTTHSCRWRGEVWTDEELIGVSENGMPSRGRIAEVPDPSIETSSRKRRAVSLLADHDVVLFPNPTEALAPWFLDALAAGLTGLVRCRANVPLPAGLNEVLGPTDKSVVFWSISDVPDLALQASTSSPGSRSTADHIRNRHAWDARIAEVLAEIASTELRPG